jgi:predicted ATPase
VAARLRELRALVVVDNFEQVVEAAGTIAMLLRACPDVKFLVTSRCVLRMKGEHEQQLAPLRSPAAGVSSPADLLRFPSVELFAQRAEAVLAGWELDEADGPAVAEICRKLDGLPLALELAAARMKILSPAALLARLGSQPDLLSRGTAIPTTGTDAGATLTELSAARRGRAGFPAPSVFAGADA